MNLLEASKIVKEKLDLVGVPYEDFRLIESQTLRIGKQEEEPWRKLSFEIWLKVYFAEDYYDQYADYEEEEEEPILGFDDYKSIHKLSFSSFDRLLAHLDKIAINAIAERAKMASKAKEGGVENEEVSPNSSKEPLFQVMLRFIEQCQQVYISSKYYEELVRKGELKEIGQFSGFMNSPEGKEALKAFAEKKMAEHGFFEKFITEYPLLQPKLE